VSLQAAEPGEEAPVLQKIARSAEAAYNALGYSKYPMGSQSSPKVWTDAV
jgi:hypothetical protein